MLRKRPAKPPDHTAFLMRIEQNSVNSGSQKSFDSTEAKLKRLAKLKEIERKSAQIRQQMAEKRKSISHSPDKQDLKEENS